MTFKGIILKGDTFQQLQGKPEASGMIFSVCWKKITITLECYMRQNIHQEWRSPHCGQAGQEPSMVSVRMQVWSLDSLSGLRKGTAINCGVDCRCSSDLGLLWLWFRPAAAALIRSLAQELPYAASVAVKSKNSNNNNNNKKNSKDGSNLNGHQQWYG